MKDIDTLIKESFYCDPATHIFEKCRIIKKVYAKNILGIYGQKLDACNLKIRYAARALQFIEQIVTELEHGEFIYLDDENRLKINFYAESYLIFIRATLDLVVSAFYVYRKGNSIDSFNDFLKKIKKDDTIIPENSREFWSYIIEDYKTEEYHTWIQTLVGREKGLSLRDMIVHKSIITIDTYIDDQGKGRIFIILSKNNFGNLLPWFKSIFGQTNSIIETIISDIISSEQNIINNG